MTATIPSPEVEALAPLAAHVWSALRDALLEMLAAASTPGPALVSASVRIPAVDALARFDASRATGEDVAFWLQPASGRSFIGVGTAASIDLTGSGRFRGAAAAWTALLVGAQNGGPAAGRPGAGPILVGGATFADDASTDPCWTGFEHGRLDVPAVLVHRIDDETILTATVVVEAAADVTASVASVMRLVERMLTGMSGDGDVRREASARVLRDLGGRPDRAEWSSSVARSSGAVGRGRIDKVVLARRVDVEASAPVDVAVVLNRLAATSAGASAGGPSAVGAATTPVTVFAFTRGARTFLGASPERLVEAHGHTFRTIALAGTTGRDVDPGADARLSEELLASEKDREEHAVVVEMLRETLAPLASRMDVDRTPHIVRLPTLQHLASDVSGVLRDDRGILDLVDRLHPTPAVGGWPRAAALELLEEQEQLDRGWYAGPVGWLDAHGDGEFVVAIRSGVVEGARASLFVGCGIVGDSEPDREWVESDMKLQSLASALGQLGR